MDIKPAAAGNQESVFFMELVVDAFEVVFPIFVFVDLV